MDLYIAITELITLFIPIDLDKIRFDHKFFDRRKIRDHIGCFLTRSNIFQLISETICDIYYPEFTTDN